jgi:hypothetical protein
MQESRRFKHRGELTRKDAEQQLNYVRGLRMRLLGDRVLQMSPRKAVALLGWPDTFGAEYITLTQLHADALDHVRPAPRPRRAGSGDSRLSRPCTDRSKPHQRPCDASACVGVLGTVLTALVGARHEVRRIRREPLRSLAADLAIRVQAADRLRR